MKLTNSRLFYTGIISFLAPLFVFADEISGSVTLDKILKAINKEIINPAIIAVFAVALAVFIFGLVRFIWDKQSGGGFFEDGKRHMVWGLVGMFIMASAFGIIQFIANTLTLDFKINSDGTVVSEEVGTGTNTGTGISRFFSTEEECTGYGGWYWVGGDTDNCHFDADTVDADFDRDGISDDIENGTPAFNTGMIRYYRNQEICEEYKGWVWKVVNADNCFFDPTIPGADFDRDGIPDNPEPEVFIGV